MRARETCLRHYGGDPVRCAWCGGTEGPWEIDHIGGGGSAHRREMTARGTNISYELQRLHYPPGYQVLCTTCHRLRTTIQGTPMPPATGKVGKHYSLRGETVKQIQDLARKQGVDESLIVEHAILAQVEGLNGHGKQLIATLAERHMTLMGQVETLTAEVRRLAGALEYLQGDVKTLKGTLTEQSSPHGILYTGGE
jgi:hypothetical protein